MIQLDEKYNSKLIEKKIQEQWNLSNIYHWKGKNDFVIDTPPPTISGSLHIGHIFSYCHIDFIARYQRMIGKDVFYPMGFDDNGLPTERLVEKKYKLKAYKTNREEFVKLCHKVSEEHRKEFRELFKRIGLSIDWRQEYNTISRNSRALSQMSFLDLYNKDQLYQQEQPMLWDIADQTAIAQAEIEEIEFTSYMNYLKFSTNNGRDITIATTRPELLPACVAIFVHPQDERYSTYIGSKAITPLFEVEVPIISDENVKIEKGSGAVMCCTFGDDMDLHWWKKHSLPMKIIINKYGRICNLNKFVKNTTAISALEGLKIKDARAKMIELIFEQIVHREEIIHKVKCAERSGSPLEILPTKQWFIKVIEHKEKLLEIVKECNWHPPSKRVIIEKWIENLKWDWCISRQRYFGVPLPLWYSNRIGEKGKIILPNKTQLPINPLKDLPVGYSRNEVTTENDVMDTWATSSLSPQLNSHYINENYKLDSAREIFPSHLRPQAHEIIRTWAFYTIVKSHLHNKNKPWHNLMISGWCLAEDKSKMSKSKGNIIEPLTLLDKYGADVIRYWTSNSHLGSDTVYSENVIKMGKRLITKIWNAGKFISNFITHDYLVEFVNYPTDLWILGSLHDAVKTATQELNNFEYCQAKEVIETFFWKDFCDNYLELVKARAYQSDANGHESSIHCLCYTFNIILRLFAPFIPFLTEKLYNNLYSTFSVHCINNWPNYLKIPKETTNIGVSFIKILEEVREFKSKQAVSVKSPLKSMLVQIEDEDIIKAEFDLKQTCNTEKISWQLGKSVKVLEIDLA